MTGFPEEPTATSAEVQTAEVMGSPAPSNAEHEAPAETPPRTDPEQKPAPRTSETMPPVQGIYRPEEHDDTPD